MCCRASGERQATTCPVRAGEKSESVTAANCSNERRATDWELYTTCRYNHDLHALVPTFQKEQLRQQYCRHHKSNRVGKTRSLICTFEK